MTTMIGPLILIAAIASPPVTVRVTTRATASVRVVSGVSFGPDHTAAVPGAAQRTTRLTDRQGQPTPAIILEFQ